MTEERKTYLTDLTKSHLSYCIEEDMGGGELLMKGVWEECRDKPERDFVDSLLSKILKNKRGLVHGSG